MSTMKTTARPSWDEYFLNVAKAISMRSTCLRRKYGAVIVDATNAIVSTGYNGSPVGAINCIDRGTCRREEMHIPKGERYELCEAVHAEQNAIINCTKLCMVGATIYIYGENADGTIASGKPCLLCARMIRNAGIKRIVSSHKDVEFDAVSWEELEKSLKDPKPDPEKDKKMGIVAFSDQDVQPYRADLSCKELTFAMAKADRMLEAAKRIGKDDYPVSDVDPSLQRIFVQYEFTGKNGTEGKGSGHILPDDKDLMTRLLELHYGKSTGDNGVLGFANSTLSVVYSPIESTIDTKSPYTILEEINTLYQSTSKIRISPEAKKAITETIPDTLANIDTTLRAKNEDSIRKAVEKFDVAPTPVIRDTFGAKAEPNDDKWHKQVRVRYNFDGKKGGESYTTEEEKEVLTRLLKLDRGPVMLHGSCESMSFKDDDMSLNVRYDTVYNEDDNGESAHQIILHIMEAYRALSDENAQDTKTKPVVGIDAMAVRIMTDITFNNNKRGCCTYIPTSQKAIFFRSMIDKFGALNCDGENAYSTKNNLAKIGIRTYLVPAEEVTVCGAGAAIDEVREVYYEAFQEYMQMPIDHKTYELNPVTVSFYAVNKDNTYEKSVNVSVAIGDFDKLIASIKRIVEAYHYSPVFLAKNVNCPNIFPGSEKYTEGNKTYSYQRDGHFDIVVVTNKATIPTTLISLADAVTAIASIVVGC